MPRPSLAEGRGIPLFRLGTLCERDDVSAILAGRTRQSRDPQRGREICPRGENLPPSGVDSPKVPPAQRGRAARAAPAVSFQAECSSRAGSAVSMVVGKDDKGGESVPEAKISLHRVLIRKKSLPRGREGGGWRAGKRSRSRQQRERAARTAPPSAFRRDVPRGGHRRGSLSRAALRRRKAR